tara:strand:- start:141 stop:488 length:348 start_codon:yes stop_codon:yes gene_type:complete
MSEDNGRNIRVWRVRLDSPGGIMMTPDKVTIQSDKNTFVSVTPGSIGLSADKIAFATQPENISKGILFAENMGFMQLIPSTIPTCIPNCSISLPGAGLFESLGEGLGSCMALGMA